jgi:hypothetical protein
MRLPPGPPKHDETAAGTGPPAVWPGDFGRHHVAALTPPGDIPQARAVAAQLDTGALAEERAHSTGTATSDTQCHVTFWTADIGS